MTLPPEAIKAMVTARVAMMDEQGRAMFAEHVKLVREQIRKDKSAAAVAGFAAGHLLSTYEKLTAASHERVSNFALAMTAAVFAFALDEEFSSERS